MPISLTLLYLQEKNNIFLNGWKNYFLKELVRTTSNGLAQLKIKLKCTIYSYNVYRI